MDDPRLSGTLWSIWNRDVIKGRQNTTAGEVWTGAVALVNDDGSWVGTVRGYVSMDDRTHYIHYELTGTDTHDGYSALLAAERSPSGEWVVEGYVFPGALPEYPDPVQVPTE